MANLKDSPPSLFKRIDASVSPEMLKRVTRIIKASGSTLFYIDKQGEIAIKMPFVIDESEESL